MNRRARARPLIGVVLIGAVSCALGACTQSGADQSPQRSSIDSARGASSSRQLYVALGDSYTSAPLVPVTDVANGCFRSSANYPALASARLRARLDDRSCGGARTADLTRPQLPDVPAQLPAVTPETDLVTLGIGGNDEGVFRQLVGECTRLRSQDAQGAPCQAYMTRTGRDVLLTQLRHTSARVAVAIKEIQARAPRAQVLVVGYPQIVDKDHVCEKLPLAVGDYAYAERVNRALSDAVRRAARVTGTTFVDVWSASRDHDVCSTDPWINGSVTDQKRAAAYHPFAAEQAAVADLVVAAARRG